MFPGLYCPGLIEAAVRVTATAESPEFPGLYCPGLIEALWGGVLPRQQDAFPGLYCPGLIEADAAIASDSSTAKVSGALLPRPH